MEKVYVSIYRVTVTEKIIVWPTEPRMSCDK